MSLIQKFQYYSQRKIIKYGLPFLVMMLGGSFALKEFTQLRYQFAKKVTINPKEMNDIGIKMKEYGEVTLETEYEKIKLIDIDNWENVRGPRPWEEQPAKK